MAGAILAPAIAFVGSETKASCVAGA